MNSSVTEASVRDQIYEIIAEQAKLDIALLKPESTLKDLGIASLTAIEVLFDIEEKFDIDFPDQGPDFGSDTLQQLVDAVCTALASKAAPKKGAA
jgi:acyl carrier protein